MPGSKGSSTPHENARTSGATQKQGPRRRSILRVRSVVGQMFVLQIIVVVLLAAGAVALLLILAQRESKQEAASRSLAVAQGFASSPGVAPALESDHPTALLQPGAEEARKGSDVDFVVVVGRDGLRYTHPFPDRIGKPSSRDLAPLLAGRTVVETRVGTLGPQIRAYVPVKKRDGTVVGAVGAGVTIAEVNSAAAEQLPLVIGGAVGAVAVSTAGAALLSRRLLRQTHGLGPAEITRLYEHHDAVLHAVKEGVVIVDREGRMVLANDEAHRLLDLPTGSDGRKVAELGLSDGVAELLSSGRAVADEMHEAGGRLLAVNQRPTSRYGPAGSVATLRDSTELLALSSSADAARRRLRVLYDASVRIGTTLEVPRTAQELAEIAVPQFADFVTVDLAEPVLRGEELQGTERVLRRTAITGVRDDHPLFPQGQLIQLVDSTPQVQGLSSGRAVVERDLDRAAGWRAQDPERAQRILDYGIHSLISAPLSARGVVLGVASFWRSEKPEPFEEDDLALAEEVTARAAVCIDNARRYTKEHSLAVTLQRSLMPRGLPAQTALEVAHRYLPAQAGVGGDWFDVIPLPGTRVAVVVGDVVGHGLHAAATMGRLRTAVHNFSSLDLAPDEILGHLDELVEQMDLDRTTDERSQEVTGVTCLYAVYDPITGSCSLASAGHPPPVVALPDGTAYYPRLSPSPPLGAGSGLPVESTQIQLPEGSRLILYTDGLVEDRRRDIDSGLALLRAAVAGKAGLGPEETCQEILDTMLPEHPGDDIALMVARTRLLEPRFVAQWEVPSDPAAVAVTRNACARQLESWGLDDIAFTTELILSELITNAIRYAAQPITVRLIHNTSLICEVSDGSSTAPHLRRAAVTDEGGRGLFLVAQLAERWGTRYTATGKVLWTEQALHARGAPPATVDDLLDQWDA
ncbi:SpoIIE family protein phosphatase [Streptomyces sp. NPDC056500]|uniref:SpoIIE family protein phosphatase n=1 Tax=Streptomyces sp. NPDC056500 TaxID=3345840 RepID=UPI0036B1D597